jgi:hypothetical protein
MAVTTVMVIDRSCSMRIFHRPPQPLAWSAWTSRPAAERAVGIMIDHGHHPDHAYATTLRREAGAAGVEPHIYAASLLRPCSTTITPRQHQS